jgi:hypothetical protein
MHEDVELSRAGKAMFAGRQIRGEHVRRVEAGVSLTHVQETSSQQSGVDQQDERDRNFCDDQAVAQTRSMLRRESAPAGSSD